MKYLNYIGFIVFVVLFAQCESKSQTTETTVNLSKSNVDQKHAQVLTLEKNASKKVDNWQEYLSLKDFLNQYQSISPNEALNNSKELNDFVRSLKDSIKPDFLVSPAFDARINFMHNETLRLFDMSHISSIKDDEVNEQVQKVLESFSSVNSKINTIVKQEELDRLVDDPKFNRIAREKDSTNSKPIVKDKNTKQASVKNQKLLSKKETAREKKMRLSKEQRVKKRQQKLQTIKKVQNDKKKKKNQ